jgi:MATE family multidrug resistance protein
MITVVIVIILGTCNRGISRIFTTEEKVVEVIRSVIWALLLYVFFDTLHGVQSGIIRGLGRQIYGSIWTLICYYILGMPLALNLAFKRDMNVTGLWLGFGIACIVLDIGFWIIIVTGFNAAEKKLPDVPATPETRQLSNTIQRK